MNDDIFIRKCLNGDLKHFGELYDKYIDKIYKFVYLKTSNVLITQDIVSDVFLSAIKNIQTFKIDKDSSFQAWLFKIAYNKVVDFYKKSKKNALVDIGDYIDIYEKQDFHINIDNKEKLKEVFDYLKTIRKDHRDIIILRIWNDLSFQEISEITGKSIDNCKKISSRILAKIKENIIYLLFLIIITI